MNGVMSKYVRHVSLFWFMLVVRISCYEFSVKSSFFSRSHRNSIRQLQLSNLKVASSKTSIFPVEFHPRLAVSKWIAPRPFLMGGVLGYPTSFLLDTWQAKDDIDLLFLALYIWQAKDKKSPNRSCRCSKCTIGTS